MVVFEALCVVCSMFVHFPPLKQGHVGSSAEILVVVDEVGQLPLPVDSLARRTHRVGERTRAATEDTNFADL